MAKLTLLPKEHQEETTAVSSFTFQSMTFIAGETQEVNAQVAIMYMNDPNVQIEFIEEDFKDLEDELLEEMAGKLECDTTEVKIKVLPKKSVVTKVKSTLAGVKPKKTKIVDEDIIEEESSPEE